MLDQALKDSLSGYMEKIKTPIEVRLQPGSHEKRDELLSMLQDLTSLSEKISLTENELISTSLASPVTFEILSNTQGSFEPRGIIFSGVPGGHEFNSLILALLQTGGVALKLDESIQQLIASIDEPLQFQTIVSLSCHACPEVVQTLNQFALVNANISNEMIDGGVYPEFIEANNIQGVPSVLLNGKPFANGQVDSSVLISKLKDKVKVASTPSQQSPYADIQDMIVLGGGPSGVAAAIYAARKGLKVTIIAEKFGGQVKDTMGIENLISTAYITGPELTVKLREHLDGHTLNVKEHFQVEAITSGETGHWHQELHEIALSSGEKIVGKTLIIATGARWRQLGVPGEQENIGQGVAYCPHCDGPFFKGKKVAVIGGGNSGVEAALDLASIVEHVTVFEFMPELKADQVLADQMAKKANIDVITNAASEEVLAENNKVVGLKYQNRETQVSTTLELDGIFVQIGLLPNTEFVNGYVETNHFKEIIIDERCKTNRQGVYASGDVSTVPYKQIVIAMGEGSKAALSAFEYLLKND